MKPILVLQHVPHENMASLESYFHRAGLIWQYVELFRRVPARLDLAGAAGLVVLGGPMNVDEVNKFPYLAREVEWIRQAVAAELPLLGICLGSQLLAKALGAKVYPNAVKEIGWYEIELQPAASDDVLFAGSAARETVFQWHGDTFDLPPGAVHLALGRECRHQAFRYGRAAWGLQFHIENDCGDCRCLAHRGGEPPRIGRVGLHRSAGNRRANAAEDAGHGGVGGSRAPPICVALLLTNPCRKRPPWRSERPNKR